MFGENMSVKLVLNTFTYNSFTNKIKPSPLNANFIHKYSVADE